jgi:hypothetical protein
MSSRSNHRLVVGALALCALLALAARPAQARESAGLVDALAARLHALVPAWWPLAASGTQAGDITDPSGRAHAAAPVRTPRGGSVAAHGRFVVRPIRPTCSGGVDPNGHCI